MLVSCSSDSAKSSDAPQDSIYTRNKQFTYVVTRDLADHAVVMDTVVLTSTGRAWSSDPAQKAISWISRRDGTTNPSGVKENASGIWIHPPRLGNYSILELSPFPEIRQPYIQGREWDRELEVGSQWSNPAWAVWQGGMLVKTHYRTVGEQTITTRLGPLTCQQVRAVARCSQGRSTLDMLFHPRHGFVLLDYVNIDGKRLRFELVSTGILNQFDGAEYFEKSQFTDLLQRI